MCLMALFIPTSSYGQDTLLRPKESFVDTTLEAGQSMSDLPQRYFKKWNEYEGKLMSIRYGMGMLYDASFFLQDENSRKQFNLDPGTKLRDFRFSAKGDLKFFKYGNVTYNLAVMYDGATGKWLVRETGVMFPAKKLWGSIYIGRGKEGFSMNKVMVGYHGMVSERTFVNDAMIPVMSDGIKWFGYLPNSRIGWNFGLLTGAFSRREISPYYDFRILNRLYWLPILNEQTGEVWHIGVSLRYGVPYGNTQQLRSRPENNIAPFFVDTKTFTSDHNEMVGLETYYRKNRWMFFSEYFFQQNRGTVVGDPFFHGGELAAVYQISKGRRPYNSAGGFFKPPTPDKSLVQGGPGMWELTLHYSYIDLNDGMITGGKMWRFTPMISWYLTKNVRLHFNYGYGKLDRFGTVGTTQYFSTRLQLQI